jgi:hypothetical protein
MSTARVELDKLITTDAGDTYGTISIRVVVLKPKAKDDKDDDDDVPDLELEEEDVGEAGKKSPLASYLEKQSYGKWCVVFLVNGQRHHAWDKTFINKDLGFNQLRDRTMIIVDLDGLAMHGMAEIIQGSRQGLFEGKVYYAIKDRIVQTLKSDPQLKKLQLDAELKMLEMESGDDAVKSKLDQLIEGHHAAAQGKGPGSGGAGDHLADAPLFATTSNKHDVVLMGDPTIGKEADLPVLVTKPSIASIRMYASQSRTVELASFPPEDWASLEDLRVQLATGVEGLSVKEKRGKDGAAITVAFQLEDDEDGDYPVTGEIHALARFKGHAETRLLKIPVVISKKRIIEPPPEIELLDDPTYLKVKSRQPVKIISGGAAIHVKLEWNGKESLIRGASPTWKISARCLTLSTFPKMGFASLGDGRLEFVLYPPHGLLPNTRLEFEVLAAGPDGKSFKAIFKVIVIEPPTPRKVSLVSLDTSSQRHPPYELKIIHQKDWGNPDSPRWDGGEWTGADAGRFIEPTETNPLFLVINMDMKLLKDFQEELVKRKLVEATVKERSTRYVSHVAYHLYQIYGQFKKSSEAKSEDESARAPTEREMQAEINRVGTTIMKVMELSQK